MKNAISDLFSLKKVQILILALLASVLFFSKLGGDGLATFDDAYYAQKAKKILETGDWFTIHFMDDVRHDNPPLFFNLMAVSYKIFGVSEYAAKFPSALLGLFTVLLLYFFASQMFDPKIGFLSAFILILTHSFLKYSRHAMIDISMAFYTTAAIFALYLALSFELEFLLYL